MRTVEIGLAGQMPVSSATVWKTKPSLGIGAGESLKVVAGVSGLREWLDQKHDSFNIV
jgi:hypothetical protein